MTLILAILQLVGTLFCSLSCILADSPGVWFLLRSFDDSTIQTVVAPSQIETAKQLYKAWETKCNNNWGGGLQRDMERFVENGVRAAIDQTGGLELWKTHSEKTRKDHWTALFLAAPYIMAMRFWARAATVVDLQWIFAAKDEVRAPWRRYVAHCFLTTTVYSHSVPEMKFSANILC